MFVHPRGVCNRKPRGAYIAATLVVVWGCSAPEDGGARTAPAGMTPHAVAHPVLHNLLRVSERMYSGAEPRGEGAFAELARLGVQTVVSVDGRAPDVEAARRHGLGYVHIPIGYDGIGNRAGRALARLVHEAPGAIYIHCHHGRHRGPAAAAVACIAAGEVQSAGALRILELAGTSQDYVELWRDVEAYRPPPSGAELPELVEVAEVSSLAAAMSLVDRAYDNLKLCREASWTTPADHPDVLPPHEALLLREGLREAQRTLEEGTELELRAWLREAEGTARSLQTSLESGDVGDASGHFSALSRSCRRCHAAYRD